MGLATSSGFPATADRQPSGVIPAEFSVWLGDNEGENGFDNLLTVLW